MILASSLYSIYLFSFVVPALVSAAAVEHRARQTSSSRPSPSSSLSTFSCRPSAPIKHADSDDDWYHPEYADDDDDEKEEEDEEDDAVGLDYIAYWNADRYNEDEDAEFADGGDDESDREEEELMIINGRYRAKAKGLPKARDTDANYSSILLGSNKDILSQATSSRLYGFSNNQHPVDDQGVNKSGVRIRALHARATPGRAGNSEYYRKNVNDKSITESSRATTFSRVGYSDNQHLVDDQGVDESGVRALHARATPSRVGNSDFRIGQSSGATTSSRVGYSNNQHFVNDQGVDESSVRVLPRATTALPPVNDLYSFYPYKTAVRTLPTSAHKFFGELGYHTRDFDQRMTDLTYIWYMPRKTVLATVGATKTVHRESVSTATVYVPKKETETVMVTVTTSLYIRYDQMDTFIFSKGWGAFKTENHVPPPRITGISRRDSGWRDESTEIMEYDGGSDDTLQTQPVEEPGERPEENSAEEVKDQAVEEVQAQAVETPEEEAQEQAVEQAVEQTEEQIEPEQAQEQVQEQTQDRAQDQSTQEIKEQAIVLTQEQAAKEAQEEAQEHVAEEAQEEVTAGESQAQPLEESGEHHEEEGANVENSTEYHEQALEEAVEEPQELSKEFRLKEEQLLSEDYQENKMPEHLKNPEPEYPQESTKNDSPIMAPWNPSTTKYFQPNESTTLVLVFDEAQETAPDSMPESKDTGSSAPITFFMTPSGTPEIQEAPVPPQTENIDKFPAQSESKDIYLDPPQGTTPSPDIPVPTPERTVRSDHKETTVIVNVAQITGFVLVGMFLSVLIVMLLVWCSQPLWWPWAQMLLLKSRKTKELTSKAAEGLEADPEEILDTPDAEVNVPQTVGMDGANSDLMASESIGSAVVATGSQGYHGGGALLHPAQRTGWYQQPMLARRVSREMAPRGRVRDLEALFNDASSASD